jgi:Na+/H+-translocating membrane pyrophosphatase
MPDYDDRAIAPPSSATVIGIVIFSILILIASGYMIYNYSSVRPAAQSTHTATTTPPAPR